MSRSTSSTPPSTRASASWRGAPEMDAVKPAGATQRREGWRGQLARALDSDLLASFLSEKLTVLAAIVTLVLVLAALLAPIVAPHSPFDLSTISIIDANMPP